MKEREREKAKERSCASLPEWRADGHLDEPISWLDGRRSQVAPLLYRVSSIWRAGGCCWPGRDRHGHDRGRSSLVGQDRNRQDAEKVSVAHLLHVCFVSDRSSQSKLSGRGKRRVRRSCSSSPRFKVSQASLPASKPTSSLDPPATASSAWRSMLVVPAAYPLMRPEQAQ